MPFSLLLRSDEDAACEGYCSPGRFVRPAMFALSLPSLFRWITFDLLSSYLIRESLSSLWSLKKVVDLSLNARRGMSRRYERALIP